MSKVYHISGMQVAHARKICKFVFGDFFISCNLIQQERIFDIKVNESLKVKQPNGTIKVHPLSDYVDIEHFKKFWGMQWKIRYDKSEEA